MKHKINKKGNSLEWVGILVGLTNLVMIIYGYEHINEPLGMIEFILWGFVLVLVWIVLFQNNDLKRGKERASFNRRKLNRLK